MGRSVCLISLSMRQGLLGKGLSYPVPHLHNHKFHLLFLTLQRSWAPVVGTRALLGQASGLLAQDLIS